MGLGWPTWTTEVIKVVLLFSEWTLLVNYARNIISDPLKKALRLVMFLTFVNVFVPV